MKALFILFTTTFLTANVYAAPKAIYTCASTVLPQDKQSNPNSIESINISIIELPTKLAGRPKLYASGKFTLGGEEKEFSMNILGVPEFLGDNMFLAYFTGSYTNNDGQRPSGFSLTSSFSKIGNSSASLSIDNRSFSIPGADDKLLLNDIGVECTVPAPSIFVK